MMVHYDQVKEDYKRKDDRIAELENLSTLEWVNCNDDLPNLRDDSVLVFFSETGSKETVHIQDYFSDITAGFDEEGNQLWTKWYITQEVTHWMELPNDPV